jgi:hypothetical protein
MTISTGKISVNQVDFVFSDDTVTATSVDNIFGGSATVHHIHMSNGGAKCYLKVYDNADPTVGTTAPDIILQSDASTDTVWMIVDGIAFDNFSYAAEASAGTSGTGNPGGGNIDLFMVVR